MQQLGKGSTKNLAAAFEALLRPVAVQRVEDVLLIRAKEFRSLGHFALANGISDCLTGFGGICSRFGPPVRERASLASAKPKVSRWEFVSALSPGHAWHTSRLTSNLEIFRCFSNSHILGCETTSHEF